MKSLQRSSKTPKEISVVALATALCLTGDSMLYIALPIYWREVGLDSIWQVGLLLSINRFIRIPINPLVGWIYKKISLRNGLLIAVVLGIVSTFGYGIVQGFIGWLILRGVWGIAWSFFRIGGLSAVVEYSTDQNRGRNMGEYNGLYRIGSLVGMLVGGLLIPIFGLSSISILFSILSLLGVPLLLINLKSEVYHAPTLLAETMLKATRISLYRKTLLLISSGFLIAMLIQGILTSTLSRIIETNFGSYSTFLGIVVSVTALSGFIQAVRWIWEPYMAGKIGQWSDGVKGRIPLYIASLVLGAIFFGMVSIELDIYSWLLIVLVVMAICTALTTLTDALATDIARSRDAVKFLSYYSLALDVGAAVGPMLAYSIIGFGWGTPLLYWGGSGILLLLSVLWMILYSQEKIISKNEKLQTNTLTG